MAYDIVTAEIIEKMYADDPTDDVLMKEIRQDNIDMARSGNYTMFYNQENKRFFAVPHGQAIPKHLEAEITGR